VKTSFNIQGRSFDIDLDDPIDISIPLRFNGEQPNAYGVDTASSAPCTSGDLIGDTRRGGSCNFERYTFIPHCNGTHTECVGHITNERISVRDCLRDVFVPAFLISVEPERQGEEFVLGKGGIREAVSPHTAIAGRDAGGPVALIVRTLPNDTGKISRQYDGDAMPPYFTADAMRYIVDAGFEHLLVDLPSIDRLFDEGKLANHRTFWNVEPDSFDVNPRTRLNSTITELIYVPGHVEDGNYLLSLQIAPFESDASPSRPVIFRTEN
jgi:hypothetical protein